MYKIMMHALLLGVSVLLGCGGQTKSSTAYDEKVESGETATEHSVSAEHEMPEPPKVKADDMER
jgi:hypothetical protein